MGQSRNPRVQLYIAHSPDADLETTTGFISPTTPDRIIVLMNDEGNIHETENIRLDDTSSTEHD